MKRMIISTAAGVLLTGMVWVQEKAWAQQQVSAQQPPVQVQGVWARATTPGITTGAIYLTLTSPVADRLVSVSTPAAGSASVHEMQMDGAIMRMRPVEGGLALPQGQAVTLKPGGYHIMLEGLKAPLAKGATVPVHLVFAHAAPVDVTAQVQAAGAAAPAAMPGM